MTRGKDWDELPWKETGMNEAIITAATNAEQYFNTPF